MARGAEVAPAQGPYDFFLIGAFRYPAGDASSNRLLALAKAAAAGGYRPLVVNDAPPLDSPLPRGSIGTFGGVDYVNTGPPVGARGYRLLGRLSRPARVARTIRRAGYQRGSGFASVASGLYTPGVHVALNWVLGLRTISDVVERHDAEQFPAGRRSPYYIRHRWTSMLSRVLPDGVIAISRTLEAVYSPSRSVLRIPPLVDLDEFPVPHRRSSSQPLTLIYSGTPTRKDQLGSLVDAVLSDTGNSRPISLLIAGADANQLADAEDVGPDRVARFGSVVKPLGMLGRAEVLEQLNRADFSVLFRPQDGYAQAGFPSKVPESLAAGCPVLGNLTSDLGDYLKDSNNAIVCEPDTETRTVLAPAVTEALDRANHLTDDELFEMKLAARASAEDLDYRAWGPVLQRWLRTLE
jgi:glycosyltransferase involved in cell wall biosynthesis